MANHTLTFGGSGTGNTATTIVLSDADISNNPTVSDPGYTPFANASFSNAATGTGPGASFSGGVQLTTLKVNIKLFNNATSGAPETVTITNTGGISFASATGDTPVAMTAGQTVTVPVPAFSTSSAGLFFYGSAADILLMLQNIHVTGPATGSTSPANNYVAVQFSWVPTGSTSAVNGSSSTTTPNLVNVVACYLSGTMIAVPGGETAVENLRIGDLLTLANGGTQKVKWIGTRHYTADNLAAAPALQPVLFRAGALGDGTPSRDLLVSPMHGMLIDDVIVPAAALVNGASITRAAIAGALDYFHVELEGHQLILAEGAVAESFIDNASREMFDNAWEYTALYGQDTAQDSVAPRVEEGYLLDAIQRRLAFPMAAAHGALQGGLERITDGVLEGWATDGSAPVELELLVEGETIARLLANRYRIDLDQAGIAGGRAGFTVALPAAVGGLGQVMVRRVADGAVLPVFTFESAEA